MDQSFPDALSTLQGLATQAGQPEHQEPGPGDVGPTIDTKSQQPGANQLVTLPMTEEEVGGWFEEIERARQRITAREEKWDILLREYMPVVVPSGQAEAVKVNAHFRNVHSKMGALFYETPELILDPKDPGPASNQMPNPMQAMMPPGAPQLPPITMEDVISVKQAVLNQKLGRDGIKTERLMDELLFDVLCWSGIAVCKVGYRCVMKDVQQPVMQPDPTFQPPQQPGSMLGLAPTLQPPMVPVMDPMTGQPKMETIQVPIYEEYYARRFSPKKWLANSDLKSSRYDEDATWQGMEFFMSPRIAMAKFGLTEEEASKAAEDDRVFKHDEDQQGSTKPPGLVHGIEIYAKASIHGLNNPHPQALNQIVLIEGLRTKPAVYRPSPDQTFDEMGKLTEDSVTGFPYRVLTIRDLADSAFPMSDSAFTNPLQKQISTWRQQSVKMRDAAIGKYLYDSSAIDEDDLKRIKSGNVGDFIALQDGRLAQGADKVIAPMQQAHMTQDDYRGATLLKQDMDETLGISSVQAGSPEETVRTATEIATVQTAVANRNKKERSRVTDFFLDLARMVDQLIMRYADENEYVHLTGQDGARRMMVWNKQMVSGRYLYNISPDSQHSVDGAQDFKDMSQLYNLAAPDPLFNRAYVLRRMARMKGLDPAKAVMQIPGMLPGTQPPHGGAAVQGNTVSQHQQANSGNRPNEPGAPNARQEQVK